MQHKYRIFLSGVILITASLACRANLAQPGALSETPTSEPVPTATNPPAVNLSPGNTSPDEPRLVIGDIPYTSPSFLDTTSEPFVLLEDQAGFVRRDRDYVFPLASQAMGPVTISNDLSLTYELVLPGAPLGTYVDVDNDGQQDTGVQVFAVAYWSNTWGGPFLDERDGTGWSSAYTSTRVDPENQEEITGGTLVVWAPDDQQAFPTDFGPDGLLFTADDPTAPLAAGYNFVDLDERPFRLFKTNRLELDLIEGAIEIKNFSSLSYSEAFDELFLKVSREYPFTTEKNIDWKAIYERIKPIVDAADDPQDYYRALREFIYSIPDSHISLQVDPEVFYEEYSGGFGLILAELSDSTVLVTDVLPDSPAAQAGIQSGAQLLSWDGLPIAEAIDGVTPGLGPYSSSHAERIAKVLFLTHVEPDTEHLVTYTNPGSTEIQQAYLIAAVDYDSLFQALGFNEQPLLPIEAEILQPSGLGYIRVNTFSDDDHLTAQLWERYLQEFIDQEVPGIIIDLRNNPGGNPHLGSNFAGFFFEDAFTPFKMLYYSDISKKFEYRDSPLDTVQPAEIQYGGPLAVLIGPDCASACEGFAYSLKNDERATMIGHFPSGGIFAEVNSGQYLMPDELSMQFPTGRIETQDGKLAIEGVGVLPDITIPVTEESALGQVDAVLRAAITELLEQIE